MIRDAVKTLFHPFATGTLPVPAEGERILFLAAEAGPRLPDGFAANIVNVQPLRPLFRPLSTAGAYVVPNVEGEAYDGALILCGKHKGENEDNVAQALTRVRPGGLIVLAGSKEDGIQPLRKLLANLGLSVEHMPKYHGVVAWFTRPDDVAAAIAKLAKQPQLIEDRFEAVPGTFSHDRIDPGSELLASRLRRDFDGNAADLGAGWGYLSVMLAEASPRTNRIDLFEADHRALDYARRNLARNCPDLQTRFFWQDLAAEPVKEKYDLVIMNPPFHEGHAADPALGQAFIKAAASALRIGGQLLMVANRGLPYEQVLAADFKESGEVCRNARFKVLQARK
ncbi:class I SAM-dependent methyltransferase [Rhizobium sp. SSA_523]|uniref:class I SAM-dependent methyltransferase n=1 Tax=Rhizobium sp. SSA_523 TaxID=2952477 RepID=UPI0020911472|nr:class I SAM-dependent methyltransferase [Rhizobium sp. SSA_523]MCO5732913.1 class I SAM-dependent methyltransferase [Rhizobium sp. SSA_523]WKC23472.1 class I SAM-dependent methyltransferase [Rhizobium sp. SSA_523]